MPRYGAPRRDAPGRCCRWRRCNSGSFRDSREALAGTGRELQQGVAAAHGAGAGTTNTPLREAGRVKMKNSLARGLSADGGADEREQLLNEHLGLVHFIARQVARGLPADTDFDELVSAGTIGLMAAHESFESERGLAFSTFAAPRIRGSILDELRRQDHVPRS